MTSFPKSRATNAVEYPSSDGKPMAETQIHLQNMLDLIASLMAYYIDDPSVYVSGNMLMYYEPLNKRMHVSPDVYVVLDLDKRVRPNYLVWEEGKAPDLVIELTSASTKGDDLDKKFKLYRDVLKVSEYFLFDPQSEYLSPSLQGYRLIDGRYAKVRAVKGRLPSKVLGLHFEEAGEMLRLFDPACGEWLRTPAECYADLKKAALARQQAEEELEELRRKIANSEENKS